MSEFHVLEETARLYNFSISIPEFESMEARDDERYEEGEKALYEILGAMDGVGDIEYNGHFGAFVYFSVNTEQVNDGNTLRLIGDIIGRYVRGEDLRI